MIRSSNSQSFSLPPARTNFSPPLKYHRCSLDSSILERINDLLVNLYHRQQRVEKPIDQSNRTFDLSKMTGEKCLEAAKAFEENACQFADILKAKSLYEAAIEKNREEGLFHLGRCYEALFWIENQNLKINPDSFSQLRRQMMERSRARHLANSLNFYQIAIQKGCTEAHYSLIGLHSYFSLLPRNLQTQFNTQLQDSIALCYRERNRDSRAIEKIGDGRKQGSIAAQLDYETAASACSSSAIRKLGDLFYFRYRNSNKAAEMYMQCLDSNPYDSVAIERIACLLKNECIAIRHHKTNSQIERAHLIDPAIQLLHLAWQHGNQIAAHSIESLKKSPQIEEEQSKVSLQSAMQGDLFSVLKLRDKNQEAGDFEQSNLFAKAAETGDYSQIAKLNKGVLHPLLIHNEQDEIIFGKGSEGNSRKIFF
jgi:tetratricopeptide (TPR) repeat protein